ncbi:hypothetical protein GF362_01805 [Candidatus Dojkabacteria bacterium]|nr:hypothetical protein [Candidatus Dojkabacteria bacterium]
MKKFNTQKKLLIFSSSIAFIVMLLWALLSANSRKINLSSILGNNENPSATREPIIIQTGSIRINNDDYKEKLTAKIDGEPKEIKENIIANIEPGEHKLNLTMEGYNEWESILNIEGGMITDINPFLFPENPNLELRLPATNIEKVFFAEYGDFVYYVVSKSPNGVENGVFQLQLTDISTIFNTIESQPVKIINIIPEIEDAINSGSYKILPSPDNKKILFKSDKTPHYIFETESPNPNPKPEDLLSIERMLGFTPEQFKWFRGSTSLIVKDKTLLTELVLSNQKNIIITYHPDHEPIYAINGDTLVFKSNKDNNLYYYKDETKKKISLENQSLPKEIEYLDIDRNNGKYIVYKTKDEYYYLNTQYSFIDRIGQNINILDFSKDGLSLLYQKDNKIFSYTIKENKVTNEIISKHNLILENYNPEIHSIQWNTISTHIVLLAKSIESGQKTITIMDRNGENLIDLFTNDGIVDESFYMLSNNKALLMLIQDSKETETSEGKNNLYNLKLTEENI